jgi:gliding motility-associated-like protein
MQNFYRFTFIFLFTYSAKSQGPLTATIISQSLNYCTNLPARFSVQTSDSVTSYNWSVSPSKGIVSLAGMTSPSASITFSLPLIYTVNITVSKGTQTASATRTVSVSRTAVAAFNASLAGTGYPNQMQLTNFSENIVSTHWKFSDRTQSDTSYNLIRYYNGSGNYTVTLVALGKGGCNDTTHYAFRISDSSSVVLPNVFTPNYDDVNDVFRPLTRGITHLNVWIYNRDGILITSWNKVNGSWDGHTTSGEECSPGQYFIIMDAKGFDGRTYKLKGNITLLR